MAEQEKQRMIDLNGKGSVPDFDDPSRTVKHVSGHEPASEGQLLTLLGCALEARDGQYKRLTEAIENLRKILRDEGVLK
jgi:hypothetical protein